VKIKKGVKEGKRRGKKDGKNNKKFNKIPHFIVVPLFNVIFLIIRKYFDIVVSLFSYYVNI
jgi:hypothetical protein